MSIVWRNRSIGLLLALAIYVLDQWMKRVVHVDLGMRLGDSIDILPIFALTRTHNYGVSLGMFQADSIEMTYALIGLTGLIAVGVLVWILREKALGDIVALAMVLGGAVGNIQDRAKFGYVLDYADLHFGDFRPFLIFNIADAAITIGVLLILARSLFMREKPAEQQSDTHADETAET